MVLLMIVVPVLVLLTMAATILDFRRMTRLVFKCTRCHAEFTRPAYRGFPRRCPACGARDWAH